MDNDNDNINGCIVDVLMKFTFNTTCKKCAPISNKTLFNYVVETNIMELQVKFA